MPDTNQSIPAVLCSNIEERGDGGKRINTFPIKSGFGTHSKKSRPLKSLKKRYTHIPIMSSKGDKKPYNILVLIKNFLNQPILNVAGAVQSKRC